MLSALIRSLVSQAKQTTQRAATGPTVIAQSDFALVAGGSPKGGWPAQQTTLSSPKGGWA